MEPGLKESEANNILKRLNSIPENDSAARSEAINELLELIYPEIRKFVSRTLRREHAVRQWMDEDDIVQSVFLKLFRSFHKLSPPIDDLKRLYAYCRVLIHRQVIDAVRMHRGRWSYRTPIEPLPEGREVDEFQEEPSQHAVREELVEKLKMAIASLPELERTIISLRYFDAMSYRDIAERLQVTPESIRMRMSRATHRLADVLREHRSNLAHDE